MSERVGAARLTLLCTARPDLLEQQPAWTTDRGNRSTVFLRPLDGPLAEALIANLLGPHTTDAAIGAKIAKAAGGNPLFLEELLATLMENGSIERRNGGWHVVGDLSRVTIPPSIDALLSARLDRLPEDEYSVLGPASVMGEVFYASAVVDLVGASLRSHVPVLLRRLTGRDLVMPTEAEFLSEKTYRFRHGLIRDAAYAANPKERRATLHERFGVWLEARAGDRVGEVEEIIGYHFEQAFRLRTELHLESAADRMLANRAASHLGTAGDRALTRGDLGAAVGLLGRTLELTSPEDPSRLSHLLALGEASIWAGLVRAV